MTENIRFRMDVNNEVLSKCVSSFALVLISVAVQWKACIRASSIYFFELDSTVLIFLRARHAVIFPVIASVILYFVYLGTKRTAQTHEERVQQMLREKSISSRPASRAPSRKTSRTGESTRRTSICFDDPAEARRLNRLLSSIEEQDTIQSQRHQDLVDLVYQSQSKSDRDVVDADDRDSETASGDVPDPDQGNSNEGTANSASRFTVEKVEQQSASHLIFPEESSSLRSRSASDIGRKVPTAEDIFDRLDSVNDSLNDDDEDEDDVYDRLAKMDLAAYLWSAVNIFPERDMDARRGIRRSVVDVIAELFAVHIPIWGCVFAFYVVLLEVVNMEFSSLIYYHESVVGYGILLISIALGIYHELQNHWISNDILAISSIYIIISRCQAISYQSAFVFIVGMAIFDVFWLYVVDLLSTVVLQSRAPIMLLMPRDLKGGKQAMATLDIIVPGIFLGLILKFSSMYDTYLFNYTFLAVFGALSLTMITAILRHKVTPAMVLPAIAAISTSLLFASHGRDLWRFMIRH